MPTVYWDWGEGTEKRLGQEEDRREGRAQFVREGSEKVVLGEVGLFDLAVEEHIVDRHGGPSRQFLAHDPVLFLKSILSISPSRCIATPLRER
jgi:hypothetical protein